MEVVNDLFLSRTKDKSVLALLSFYSAFDTINHSILVHRLHTDLGITDTVLWYSSYLTDRTHYVSLSNHCSAFAPVHSGVLHGSVLGPILFTMYCSSLTIHKLTNSVHQFELSSTFITHRKQFDP